MFIRNALIEGEWNTHHHFFHDNVKKLEEAVGFLLEVRQLNCR